MNQIQPLIPYASSTIAKFQRQSLNQICSSLGIPHKLFNSQDLTLNISIPKESFDRFSSSMASARQSIERFTLQVSGEARKIETILQKHFSKFQIELAGKEFYRKAGKTIPGSNRTKRLRKKRRKAIEAAGRNESLVNIRWNPIIAHPPCNPIRRLI